MRRHPARSPRSLGFFVQRIMSPAEGKALFDDLGNRIADLMAVAAPTAEAATRAYGMEPP